MARKHCLGADYNDRGLPKTAVIFFAVRGVVHCVIAAPAKKKADDDAQAANIAAPTSNTGVNAWG